MRAGLPVVIAVVAFAAVAGAPRVSAAGEAGDVTVVSGGPKDAGKKKAVVASIAAIVGHDLGVCMVADRPASVRVEVSLAADGKVTAATQRTDGAVAQCIAGILAVKTLARTGSACTITVEIGLGEVAEDFGASVERQIAAERETLAGCQASDAKGKGGIDLKFTIEKDGSVSAITVAKTTVSKPIEDCLKKTLATLALELPAAKSVKYALHLDFAGGSSDGASGEVRDGVARTPGEASLQIDTKRATSDGSLDSAQLDKGIRAGTTPWLACYKKALKVDPTAGGKVVVRFTVRADGTVKNNKIKESTANNPAMETCISDVAKQLTFPESSGETKIVLPLMFDAG